MSQKIDIAVVGADTAVGEALLDQLSERSLPLGTVFALAQERLAGETVAFGNRELILKDAARFDFAQVKLVFFAAQGALAAAAAQAGACAIDLSGVLAADPDVPMIVPELNGALLRADRRLYSTPSSLVVQLALVLQPLQAAAGLERVSVSSYEAVSAEGRAAVESLGRQTADLLSFRGIEGSFHGKQLAFNVIPQVGSIGAGGHSDAELRVAAELRRLLGGELRVNVTAVRVPVFYGHSAAVQVETRERLEPAAARVLLEQTEGIEVIDRAEDGGYPTAVDDASGQDHVFVGRIREDLSHPRGLNLWVVSDNIRRGAALNAVRIAERLVEYLR